MTMTPTLLANLIKRPWSAQAHRISRFSTSSTFGNRVTPISKHFKKIPLKNYHINYIKVGHGPHAVFCFPGIVGAINSHLAPLVLQFEKDADKFTFYAWDQPGFGSSRPPERKLTADSMDEDAEIFIEFVKTKKAINHDKVSLLGWSGGGCSALKVAIQWPELVNKMLVWGAFAYVDKADSDNYKVFRDINSWGGKMKETLLEEYDLPFLEKYWADWMDAFCDIHSQKGGEYCSKELHKITCPTMIVHGAKDNIVYLKHGQYLQKNIKGAELKILEHGKHNLQLRWPEEFYSIVKEFLLR